MNKSRILFSCALGVGLALTSCQDEDFGVSQQEVAQVAYNRNFESVFGKVDPDQDFDFYAQIMNQLQGGAQTRAGGSEVTISDFLPYAIDDAVINIAHETFPEKSNNSAKGTQAGTLVVQSTKFTVSSVDFGGIIETSTWGTRYVSYGFEFGVEVGGKQYRLWGPYEDVNRSDKNYLNAIINPKWSKEVTVPYGSAVRFYISYYGDWNAENEGKQVTAIQCGDCGGKGHTTDKCEVCGGDGKVEVTETVEKNCTNNSHSKVSGDYYYYVTSAKGQPGAIECPSHNGRTYRQCSLCGGYSTKGYIAPCPTCNGTGKYSEDTTKEVDCTAEGCHNGLVGEDHVCETCNGRGVDAEKGKDLYHIYYSDGPHCVIATKATEQGAQADKLFQVLGFEDDVIEANALKGDFQDFIVAITAEELPLVITDTKRFMCEDMTGSNRETSWDFNDIVFDISAKETTQGGKKDYETVLTLQAVGGTWPIKLFITDNTTTHQVGEAELHEYLGYEADDEGLYPAINVGAGASHAAEPFTYTDIKLSPSQLKEKNYYVYAKVYKGEDKSQWKTDKNEKNWKTITFQAPGEPARIISCTPSILWMKEDQKITKSYNFPNDGWWNSLVSGGAQYLYTGN